MASGLGDGYRNMAMNAILGGTGYSFPATVYVALLSTAITDSAGTSGVELSGSGYARVAKTNNGTNFTAASGGSISNATTISFPTVTGSSWASVVGFALYDDISSTAAVNLIAWGTVFTPRVFTVGQTASFAAGQLIVSAL